MNLKRILFTSVAIVAVVLIAYLSVGMERYCLIYPGIDTRYAAAFTERKFAQVRVGMTKEEVVSLLGDPFGGTPARESSRWSYTQDGKCFWADWAWLGREIVFSNGRVAERVSRVYYD